LLSDAIVALGRGEIERACGSWGHLTSLDARDFAAWYGLGSCLSHDDAVVADPTSPSGWQFRSSYNRAIQAYRRAFQLLPSIHTALSGRSYQAVRSLLMTNTSSLRRGRALAADSTVFVAFPTLEGDTVAFVPFPAIVALSRPTQEATGRAVRRERELFHEIAAGWVTAFPRSADALEALAISLEMLGDPAA